MKKTELMEFTLKNKEVVANTILDLCCEVLRMEPIGEVDYGGNVGTGFDGGASLEEDHLILSLERVTGEYYPNESPGEGVLTHLTCMVAHEVKHAFQRRAIQEPERIFEENEEFQDKARIKQLKKDFRSYMPLNGVDYELHPLELDAECFAGLIVYIVTGNVQQPVSYAANLYEEATKRNLKYYAESIRNVFTQEHFDKVLEENFAFWKEAMAEEAE